MTKGPRKPRGCRAADGQASDSKKPLKVTKRRKATTSAVADSNDLPGLHPRSMETPSDSEEHSSPCKIEDGYPGCLVVGFLKNEDGADEDEGDI